ncbi:MAG: M23 family metallopeptidase [Akkermansiaceae bacterium]
MMKLLGIILFLPLALEAAETLKLVLPTDNQAIFDGKPEDFYMYVLRYSGDQASQHWTAGQYGFVRTVVDTEKEGPIATKFHEGLDIKPTKRDRSGNPLDEIRSIADGEIVHVNDRAGGSSYGKYLVIKHNWDCGPFYSLYAHLSRIDVAIGDRVIGGSPIAIMGYTGAGINRTRAHLHLELCMLSTENFADWIGAKTPHGIYDGRNLIGVDVASLFLATKDSNKVTMPGFLDSASPYFKVAIPRKEELEITKRYPWLKKGDHSVDSPSLEISFTDSGIPLSVVPSHREVTKPSITFVRTTRSKHEYYTRGRLTGTGRKASLTRNGLKFVALFTNEYTKPKANPTAEESDDS